jgi:hypothetical protein
MCDGERESMCVCVCACAALDEYREVLCNKRKKLYTNEEL